MPLRERFHQLNARANKGDPQALQGLQSLLDENPHIWQQLGNLGAQVEAVLIAKFAQCNVAFAESLKRKCQEMRTELLGDEPTPLEKTSVDRVIYCWLEVHLLDTQYKILPENITFARRVDQLKNSAQRRYETALRSLQLVKKLPGDGKVKPKAKTNQRLRIVRFRAAS